MSPDAKITRHRMVMTFAVIVMVAALAGTLLLAPGIDIATLAALMHGH
jgi:hypothetical protein